MRRILIALVWIVCWLVFPFWLMLCATAFALWWWGRRPSPKPTTARRRR